MTLALLLPLLLTLAWTPARAQRGTFVPRADSNRLVGQVVSVYGSGASPTGIMLFSDNHVLDIKLTPATMLVPRSAEAEVEGLVTRDYAIVVVRRTKLAVQATKVTFDVQPWGPSMVFPLSGVIMRTYKSSNRIDVKLDTGYLQTVAIPATARFRVDGQLVDTPPPLKPGSAIQGLVWNSGKYWVAVEINVRNVKPGPPVH